MSEMSRDVRAADALRESRLFAELDAEVIHTLEPELEWFTLAAGDLLLREGDSADALFVVASGRLRATRQASDGGAERVADLGRGECIGELALITGEPRGATIRAMRDSALVRLSRAAFDRLLASHPETTMGLARSIVRRYAAGASAEPGAALSTVAVIPISEGVSPEFARAVASALGRLERTACVDAARIDAELGAGSADLEPASPGEERLLGWLDGLERQNGYVVYACSGEEGAWSKRCLRQADRLLLVGRAEGAVTLDRLWWRGQSPARAELALIHAGSPLAWRGAREWLEVVPVHAHHHVTGNSGSDLDRLARRLTDRANGVALGGGGSRTAAYVGMLRALEEAAVPIDVYAGTSGGAVIGALAAQGLEPGEIRERLRRLVGRRRPALDLGPPFVSVFSGRGLSAGLRELIGEVPIESLPRGFWPVCSDLTSARVVVPKRGLAWLAVRASSSTPVLFPPVEIDGHLLVDGGVLNNLPADLLRQPCARGRLIACDVSTSGAEPVRTHYGESLSGWKLLGERLNPFAARSDVPSVVEIALRAASLYSRRHAEQSAARDADLYLAPPMKEFALLGQGSSAELDELEELGYRWSRERLDQKGAGSRA